MWVPIWNLNLATPDSDIEGFFDIEAFNIEGCFDIEYTTFDIEVFASMSKLTKNLRYLRNLDIRAWVEGWTFDIGFRYQSYSISKLIASISVRDVFDIEVQIL
jgi:hypothetical protein